MRSAISRLAYIRDECLFVSLWLSCLSRRPPWKWPRSRCARRNWFQMEGGKGWEWGRKNWQRREVESIASFIRGFVVCAVRTPVCPESDKTSVLSQHRRAGWRRNPGWRMLTSHFRVRQTRTPEAAVCQPSVLVADSCQHPSPSLLDLRSSLGFVFGPRDLSSPLSTISDLAYAGGGGVISWSLT